MNYTVIDGNAIGYIGQALKKLTNGDGQATQSIYHFAKTIPNLAKKFPNSTPIVLWDSHCQWRYDLLPEYKGKRDATPELKAMRAEYRTQRPFIQDMLSHMGVMQWTVDNYEADDLAGFLARKVLTIGGKLILVTGDKDWLQLVSGNVLWYSPVEKIIVGVKNFHQYTGYRDGVSFLQGKALQGDNSDNISSVGGLGKETAPKILDRFGSIQHLMAAYRANGDFCKEELVKGALNKSRKKLNDFCRNETGGLDIYKRNMKLMNLLQHVDTPPNKILRSEYSEDDLLDLFYELNFNFMAKQVPQILKIIHPHSYAMESVL